MDWKIIIEMFGYLLIWAAIDYGRPERYKIKTFSKDGFILLIMVIIAVLCIRFDYFITLM